MSPRDPHDNRPLDPQGNVSDVDWERFQVHSRAMDTRGKSHSPLGDPLTWGARVTLPLTVVTFLGGPVAEGSSPQILRAQCKDTYPRTWTMLGTLEVPVELTNALAPTNHPVLNAGVTPALVVQMGAGQAVTTVNFDLSALIALAAPFYTTAPVGPRIALPWVISGGLIGQAINDVHLQIFISPAPFPLGTNFDVNINAQLSVFAAGTGL